MENETPSPEHQWLQQLLGEWRYLTEVDMGPDQAAQTFAGSERVRSLGALWLLAEGKGEMPGGDQADMLMTLGYDARRKCFVGSWVGSMMSHYWIYQGSLDATGKCLTLESEGPDYAQPGRNGRYRDVIEIQDAAHRSLTSYTQGEDGQWRRFMVSRYQRSA